ncbi:hypothetical protein C7447_102339 [Tenacibaculum adriaticum]|uniref:Uncharacterized protein n=1 Tax=Tenacibaculum adriaticum TaxID=413713 RepID=A0A5S5DSZ7_9FLAO|nr:hypothetical protein [Tenacibaculum adriaticum]TYP99021.1 hypothetical protein C7447_102339 [Tenacibaculum adriaticum]
MHKKLILLAFQKAKNDEENETGIIASTTKLSERISAILWNQFKCTFGEKSLRNLYKDAINSEEIIIEIKQPKVTQALCKYVGFDNYADFISKTQNSLEAKKSDDLDNVKNERNNKKFIAFIKANKVVFLISFLMIIIVFTISSINKQRWMVWKEDHYVEVKFDTEKYNLNQLKLFKKDRIENFRKIIPNCETLFFKKDGSINVWYGKNRKGELELFTSVGLHPETGKTLKPITTYMIKKYICETYN